MPETHALTEFFRWIYDDLKKSGNGSRYRPLPPDGRIYPDAARYPGVFVWACGDAFGPYQELVKYLRDCRLTGKRRTNGPFVGEAHHLMEDRCMQYFGITRNEGFSVALDDVCHSVFSTELPFHLIRGQQRAPFMADIDVVYDAHKEMYSEEGYTRWLGLIRDWLKRVRHRIEAQYVAGKVPFATAEDVKRVKEFFAKL